MSEEIHVLNKKVHLLQPEGGFRTSLDSVMLAASCPAKAGDRVLDLGCGVCGASFCLLYRVDKIFVSGLDIQPEYIDLACKNATLNNNTDRCEFSVGDVRTFQISDMNQRFAHVVCNPPFLEAGSYTPSPDEARAAALGHLDRNIDLSVWIDCSFHALRSGGSLAMIHRADHVDKIVQGLGKRFGQIEIFPLWPHVGEPAKRVIVRAVKDRRSPARIHAGLILHNPNGEYTPQAEAVLRYANPLF
ncbi:MAG TPA: methyltransferase [Micavibrio sp.]